MIFGLKDHDTYVVEFRIWASEVLAIFNPKD
jgi:hypothetical protein